MNKPVLKFKKLNPEAKIPQYAHDVAAGMDLYSLEEKILEPNERYIFDTQVAAEIPQGHFISFRDKSGLAAKQGIQVLGGVLDENYRGSWMVILLNTGMEPYTIEKGDKITQAILQPVSYAQIEEVDEISETDRGEGRFGSTGRK
jgi:dUTP pyrophosphatase